MHSHEGVEWFYMVSGHQDVLTAAEGEFSWIACNPGDFIQVKSGSKHAFRNRSAGPAISLVCTTAKLGHFFEEIGRRVSARDQYGSGYTLWLLVGDTRGTRNSRNSTLLSSPFRRYSLQQTQPGVYRDSYE